MSERKCENCEFCQEVEGTTLSSHYGEILHFCHGHAPKMVNDRARWPIVNFNDWCFKHTYKKGKKPQTIATWNGNISPFHCSSKKHEFFHGLYRSIHEAARKEDDVFTAIENYINSWENDLYIVD